MALDPLSIASDGLLSKYKPTLSIATRGYISQYAIVSIEIPSPGVIGEAFGYLITDNSETMPKKESMLMREDDEVMLIIQIFMMRWN